MKQRLGIAVSLLHKPSVLILDEPTNGLDPKGIRDLRHYLQRLAREDGVTLLVSSHQLNEIEMLCDKAIIIKHGEVIEQISMNTAVKEKAATFNIQIEARACRASKKCACWLRKSRGSRREIGTRKTTV